MCHIGETVYALLILNFGPQFWFSSFGLFVY